MIVNLLFYRTNEQALIPRQAKGLVDIENIGKSTDIRNRAYKLGVDPKVLSQAGFVAWI